LVVGLVLVAVVAAIGGTIALLPGRSADVRYLTELRTAGLGGQFGSDAAAVAHARGFCRDLLGGAKTQGSDVERIGVSYYCPQFSPGFHVLQTAHVSGTLTLSDYSYYSSGIASYGSTCSGTGGYSDIDSGATVRVSDADGHSVANTSLGSGTGSEYRCVFTFSFDVTEGSDDYVVSVSHRGEQHYTFTQLQNDSVNLTLGS
jgi:hypothetical protein